MKTILISVFFVINIYILFASTTPKIEWSHVIPFNQDSLLAIQGMQVISTSDGGCLVSVQSELSLPIFSKYSSTGTNEWIRFRPLDVHKQFFSPLKVSYDFNTHQLLEVTDGYLMFSFYFKNLIYGYLGNLGRAFVTKDNPTGIGEFSLSSKEEDKLLDVYSIKPYSQGEVLIATNPASALGNSIVSTKNGFNIVPQKFSYFDASKLYTIPMALIEAEDSSHYVFNGGISTLYNPYGPIVILKFKDTSLLHKFEIDRSITGVTSKAFTYVNAHYVNGLFYIIGNAFDFQKPSNNAFLMVVDTNKLLHNFTMFDEGTVANGSNISSDKSQVSIVGYFDNSPSKRQFFAVRFNTSNFYSNSYRWNVNEGSDDRLMRAAFGNNNELLVTGGSNNDCYTAKLQNEPITSVQESTNSTESILYPNPTSGILNFSPSIQTKYKTLELYDMFNRLVRTIRFDQYNSTVLSVEQLSQGVYTAVFKGINGNKVEKIIIHR